MTTCARRHLSTIIGLASAPSALITRLSDDADQLWDPFLVDDPHAAMAGER